MRIIAQLFKKKEDPTPYDWQFLKDQCLLAIRPQSAPAKFDASPLGDLDFERLQVSGEDAENVVIEIHAVLTDGKTPSFSSAQAQEFLLCANELLRNDITASAAAAGLRGIEAYIRKSSGQGTAANCRPAL